MPVFSCKTLTSLTVHQVILKSVQDKGGGRPPHATACMRHLIAFQQNLLLEIIYRISFWVSWSNILNHTEPSNLIFTKWNKTFRDPPSLKFQRYLAMLKKKKKKICY